MHCELLTGDDLDGRAQSAFTVEDPLATADAVVDAVEGNRLADPGDRSYALTLAAKIHDRGGDVEQAIEPSERAVAADRQQAGSDTFAEVYLGELLLRSGRVSEGLALLSAKRALMATDPQAGRMLAEALEAGGQAQRAVQ